MARPTKYKPEYAKQAWKLALLGLTDVEMAGVFDVSEVTFNAWKKKFPLFLKSLKAGKVEADANVAVSLFERSCGYSHPEMVITQYQGEVTKTRVTKHYPPDTLAAAIWLYNRQPSRWKRQPDETQTPDAPTPVRVVIEVRDASIPAPA